MAGNMHEMIVIRDDFHPLPGQAILQRIDGKIVSRDDARRKDDGIAGIERDVRIFVPRNPRERRTRLALAAGAKNQDFAAFEVCGFLLGYQRRKIRQIAVVARSLIDAAHGTAHQHELPAMCLGRFGDRFQPRNIRSKTSHCNSVLET